MILAKDEANLDKKANQDANMDEVTNLVSNDEIEVENQEGLEDCKDDMDDGVSRKLSKENIVVQKGDAKAYVEQQLDEVLF